LALALAATVIVAGCASRPDTGQAPGSESAVSAGEADLYDSEIDDTNDPLEIPNRFLFAFNMTLDVFIIKPAAATYRFLVPTPVRDSLRSFLRNLRTPVILANDLFQGEFERAQTTLTRFALNTTVGVVGLFDVADGWGYAFHDEDFGQTLGSYGIGEGVYLVLPLFGPSSVRDGVGLGVDVFLDPLTYVASEYDLEAEFLSRPLAEGIDKRSRNIETLEDLQRDSIDFYARVRSLYRQSRRNQIENGRAAPQPLPGLSTNDFEYELDDEQVGNVD